MANSDVTPEPIWLSRLRIGLWLSGGVAMALSLLLLGHDAGVSQWLRQERLPGDLRKAISLSEAFAHGSGVAAILLAIYVSASNRQRVWIAVGTTAASGIAANLLKALFTRARPYTYDGEPTTIDVTGWQFLGTSSFWDASQRSFPSGHTATAWGLAIGLSCIYPRGCAIFVALALLATFQRMTSGAHFPSDVCAGFTVACWCSAAILSLTWTKRQLRRDARCGAYLANVPGEEVAR